MIIEWRNEDATEEKINSTRIIRRFFMYLPLHSYLPLAMGNIVCLLMLSNVLEPALTPLENS